MGGLVIVGVDGSASSLAAVEAAAREARLRTAALKVVHAFLWPAMHVPLGPSPLGPPEGGMQNMVDRLVAEAVERARAAAPEVEVSHAVVTGEPLTVLEAQSRAADLVVVGSRGMGGFVGLMVGSTAVHLAAHARCPVLVVREEAPVDGPVVVGVDGSPAGDKAVEFAFQEAELHGSTLIALHAWTTWNAPLPAPQDPTEPYANPAEALGQEEKRLLSEALAGHRERHPDVAVEHETVHGPTREALIEASRTARLVVVGARGRGGFSGLLLGSVSQALLHHAHCPVAVVRGTAARH
ncbi:MULTISPECIES: universal stress protein [Streptomyces]|uniref:Nucleotide-binding universal stress UspA family protein n=1 Tax=Streptomyces albogriseolus TaxID=1887 RepID=A0ACC6UFC6_STRAO|nr:MULTISPECIES: universal stress protein [Streptomyces]MCP9994005.1 universal stress protein [Streptomyces albogriseolus]MCX4565005.1 universal stress protein [Streptomyces viridodiastaticus]MCX4618257.1 universal stress protein [Streptomyces viridodiastaticus]NIL53955.1 universal stress protein [Streptomyces sp. 2BBP-J2]